MDTTLPEMSWPEAIDPLIHGSAYIALYVSPGIEVRAADYRRQFVLMGIKGDTIQNLMSTSFPAAKSFWGTLTYFGLASQSEESPPVVSGPLTRMLTVSTGDVVGFRAGDICVEKW